MKKSSKYILSLGFTLVSLFVLSSVSFAQKAAKPTMSPAGGTYTGPLTVTISCTTPGVTIRYTTDGVNPTSTRGTIYTGPLRISADTHILAVAYGNGYSTSSTADYIYRINAPSTTVAAPVFSPAAGTYNSTQSVTITSSTSGASIRYTTDGTTPTYQTGTLYTGAITVSATTSIKAIAYKDGMNNSSVTSGTFTIQTIPVSAPVFTPAGGTFNDVQTVTISSATSGATIRYTTDGSTPTASTGTVYSSPISVTTGMTIKAIAYKSGLIDSSVSSSVYILKCADPIFTPAAGGFDRPTTVTITSATPGATIRYTTNGTEPTVSSGTIYSSAIPVNVSMTIKAIAYKTNFTNSDVVSGTYSLGSEDGDNDGVIDVEDDYPQDATRALNNFFPSTGSGTVAFEDLWPSQGDFDLNDVVVDFSFKTITNASNKLVETYATFVLRATGAALRNGFGFQLASNSIPASAITVTGMNLTKDYITLGSNGTEEGQSKPTFIVFDNAFDLLANPGTGSGINVTIGAPYVEPATITLHIVYTPNTYDAELLDIEHFNPFIIVNMVRGREVHLPDYAPTSLQDMTMFGTFDDNSIPVINRYYKTSTNLPWGFMTLESFAYPAEKTPIMDCYIHFAEWAQSSGQKYPDWYKDLPGYRNTEKLYHK